MSGLLLAIVPTQKAKLMQIKITPYDSGKPIEPVFCTLAQFAADNADGIDASEITAIEAALNAGQTYRLAGFVGGFSIVQAVATFEEFQATRETCDDIGKAISCDMGREKPVTGFLYLGGLYIEKNDEFWPIDLRDKGAYHLTLEREEWVSNDLESLERRLYDFHLSYS
jgi:hypothetical protein